MSLSHNLYLDLFLATKEAAIAVRYLKKSASRLSKIPDPEIEYHAEELASTHKVMRLDVLEKLFEIFKELPDVGDSDEDEEDEGGLRVGGSSLTSASECGGVSEGPKLGLMMMSSIVLSRSAVEMMGRFWKMEGCQVVVSREKVCLEGLRRCW
jgi:hypothetical protein